MLPMERSRIFEILTEIFRDTKWEEDDVVHYIMKEDASNPHDINFMDPCEAHRDGLHDIDYWLRIIDPRDDCLEYNFVLHSAISNRDANIAIDGAGNYRIYGDYINSVVYTTIKNNIRKFCDYAVELTELESRQAFEHVVAIINTYTNELMDIHAGEFVQRDVIQRSDCTNFVIKTAPYMWNALGVDVLRHFHKESVHSNDVWIRFDFGNSCCTPIQIYPFRHEVKLEGGQLEKITGGIITMGECVHIAERIAKYLEYFVTTDSGNTWVKKAVGDINKPKEDKMIGCEDVFDKAYTDYLATGSLKEDVLKPLATQMEEIVDKKIRKLVESGRLVFTSKDYLTDQIFSQLKNDWQKDVYLSVYSSVWCALVESRFKSAAFELEKHFMEYVTLDHDDCFTVRFGLQKIDDNLPGIEINFYSATQEICVRMLDHKASGSGTWSRPLIRLRPSYESIVYFDKIKNTNCTYKSFLANVVSKIVLLEGLS